MDANTETVPALDDLELLERTARREQGAFDILYQRHARAVAWLAGSLLGIRGEAEEAVQAAFLALWIKAGRITLEGDSVLPWLWGACRLECRKIQSRNAAHNLRIVPTDIADHRELPPSGLADPEQEALRAAAMKELDHAVSGLSEVDQAIFRLCLVNELTYQEAAQRLGLTHGSVRNRLSRLRGQLRARLSPPMKGSTP